MVQDEDIGVKMKGLLHQLRESLFHAQTDSVEQNLLTEESQREMNKMIRQMLNCRDVKDFRKGSTTNPEVARRAAIAIADSVMPEEWGAMRRVDISYWREDDGVHYSVGGEFDDVYVPPLRGLVVSLGCQHEN